MYTHTTVFIIQSIIQKLFIITVLSKVFSFDFFRSIKSYYESRGSNAINSEYKKTVELAQESSGSKCCGRWHQTLIIRGSTQLNQYPLDLWTHRSCHFILCHLRARCSGRGFYWGILYHYCTRVFAFASLCVNYKFKILWICSYFLSIISRH